MSAKRKKMLSAEDRIAELERQIKEMKQQRDRDWSAQFAGYPGYD
jgi:hypothetical protein